MSGPGFDDDAWSLPRESDHDEEDRPYVCPGCHAVAAPCSPGCIDKAIEDRDEYDRETREMYGDTECDTECDDEENEDE